MTVTLQELANQMLNHENSLTPEDTKTDCPTNNKLLFLVFMPISDTACYLM